MSIDPRLLDSNSPPEIAANFGRLLGIIDALEARVTVLDTLVVSFDADGGAGTIAALSGGLGSVITLPPCTFTPPEGQAFKAWQDQEDLDYYYPGDELPVTRDSAGVLNLSAIWDTAVFVTYDANGGTGTTEDPNNPHTPGEITALECAFTPPAGKVFSTWNNAADGSGGLVYAAGASMYLDASTTLYAIWEDA